LRVPLIVESQAAPTYEDMMNSHFHRSAVMELAKAFEGEIVDLGSHHMILQLTTWPRRVDAFIRMMRPYGIIEVARSGT
jgi:acetolactate synthase-1/3 small subunit